MNLGSFAAQYGPDLLQGAGACWVVVTSWRARVRILTAQATYDGIAHFLEQLREAVAGQFRDQALGLGVLLAGVAWKVALG